MNTHPQESLMLAVSKYLVARESSPSFGDEADAVLAQQLREALEQAQRDLLDFPQPSPSSPGANDDLGLAYPAEALRLSYENGKRDGAAEAAKRADAAFDPVLTSAALVVHAMINRRAELSESSQKSVDHHLRLFYRIASRLLDVAAELSDELAPREVSPWGEFQGLASEIAVLRTALSAVEGT